MACSRGSMQSCGCDRDKLHSAAAATGQAVVNTDYTSDGGSYPQSWSATDTKQTIASEEVEDEWKWGGCR